MAGDVLVVSLPRELLEHILLHENLQISDVMSFALTCKQLYSTVTTSNKLWKTKFLQRWPLLEEAFKNQDASCDGRKELNWRDETKERMLCRSRLMVKLSQMSAKHYERKHLAHSNFKEYDALFLPEHGAHSMNYDYLIDELITLIEESVGTSNLTHQYYAYKVIRYLRQTYLAKEWQKYLALPLECQTTEHGAILVAQWCQPEQRVSAQRVSEMLDEIAQQTRMLVAERYPSIPINQVPPAQLNTWKNKNICDNAWSNEDSRIIVTTLCEIMFNRLEFSRNIHRSFIDPFIDQVLIHKRGALITLAIVFESAARRLGLHCETVSSSPYAVFVKWKERYIPKVKEDENVESYYIDAESGGLVLTKNGRPESGLEERLIVDDNVLEATSPVQVVQRMADYIQRNGPHEMGLNFRVARNRSALDLLHMLNPRDTVTIDSLASLYINHRIDVTELKLTVYKMLADGIEEENSRRRVEHVMDMLEKCGDYGKYGVPRGIPTPKIRTAELKYAVGMIMQHKWNGRCVINGWVTKVVKMEVPREIHRQPRYFVCCDDGIMEYVHQKDLSLDYNPRLVNHHEIGMYFCKRMGTYYLPNEELAKEYPDDEEIRNQLIAKATSERKWEYVYSEVKPTGPTCSKSTS